MSGEVMQLRVGMHESIDWCFWVGRYVANNLTYDMRPDFHWA
jgi:hypothetical protein